MLNFKTAFLIRSWELPLMHRVLRNSVVRIPRHLRGAAGRTRPWGQGVCLQRGRPWAAPRQSAEGAARNGSHPEVCQRPDFTENPPDSIAPALEFPELRKRHSIASPKAGISSELSTFFFLN